MTNAGRTRSFGGEASLLATLWRNLDLQVAYGYTRATFVKFDTGKADYAGTHPYAPQHTLYAGASYTLRTGWNSARNTSSSEWLPTVRPNLLERSEHLLATLLRPAGSLDSPSNTATGPSMSGDAT